jgi:hypothetical protein
MLQLLLCYCSGSSVGLLMIWLCLVWSRLGLIRLVWLVLDGFCGCNNPKALSRTRIVAATEAIQNQPNQLYQSPGQGLVVTGAICCSSWCSLAFTAAPASSSCCTVAWWPCELHPEELSSQCHQQHHAAAVALV